MDDATRIRLFMALQNQALAIWALATVALGHDDINEDNLRRTLALMGDGPFPEVALRTAQAIAVGVGIAARDGGEPN